jgi:hypothetical protein
MVAIEIKLRDKYRRPSAKQQKSTHSISGVTGGKKHRVTNGMSGVAREQMKKEAADQTARNKMVLLILPSGKRRFMRLSEYNAQTRR